MHKDSKALEALEKDIQANLFVESRNYRKGQCLFRQGEPCHRITYVRRGLTTFSILLSGGKESIVFLPGHGDFLGDECLSDHLTYRGTSTAITDCSVFHIEGRNFARALLTRPSIQKYFINCLISSRNQIDESIADLNLNLTEKRLARLLLRLTDQSTTDILDSGVPPIRQEILAEIVGTSRSRVNILISKFRNLGAIHRDKLLRVDRTRLEKILRAAP